MRSASAKVPIIQAAIRLFGEHGIETTSLRKVAREAAVSPALVVHHFGSKDGLMAAADETAVREFAAAYASENHVAGSDLLYQRAAQTAQTMRAHPEVCAYLGRALIEGTLGSARLFRLLIEGGRAEIDALAELGAMREDVDLLWATLQHFFLIWAPLSFMPMLREALGGSLLEEGVMDRWVSANVRLLEKGLYR